MGGTGDCGERNPQSRQFADPVSTIKSQRFAAMPDACEICPMYSCSHIGLRLAPHRGPASPLVPRLQRADPKASTAEMRQSRLPAGTPLGQATPLRPRSSACLKHAPLMSRQTISLN